MRKTISIAGIILLSQLVSIACNAQHITSKVALKYSFGTSFLQNNKFDDSRNFPSLFPNYNNSSNSIGLDYLIDEKIGVGLNIKFHKFSNWTYPEINIYDNSKTSIIEISPALTYFFNDKKALHEYSITLRPIYSIVKAVDMNLTTNISDNQEPVSESTENPIESKYSSFGGTVEINYCYYISDLVGIYFTLGYTYIKTESIYSIDESINMYNVSIGLKLNVAKNKLYRYE